MSAQEDSNQAAPDDASESKAKVPRPGKEKKRRRRSRSKQKEPGEAQYFEQDYPYSVEDDGDNSCSSTPKYERNDEPCYPSGGLICALCYCGEKSLLGQGDLTRYSPTSGFNPFKKPPLRARGSRELLYGSSPGSNGSQEGYSGAEKVTKTAAVQRRGSKHMRETVKPVYKNPDYIDELSTVGCSEVLDVSQVFEQAGHVTAHHCCAAWSEGVTQNENYNLLCVDKAVHSGMSQRCHSCSRYGATIKCRAPKCERLFHYPCAAGSGCFQDIKSMSLLCTDHLELAPTIADPDELNCAVCDDPGQISDLLFCTSCGHHYHGDCLDPHVDVNPVVRAGWQCPECKICQTCRQPGDDNKMLVCDVCDKGYHTFCLRPAMTFIPKNGWCCKNCRRCTDCGSRTPGNGPSSRWHINYQVCDSCYQLRNKGSSCPVCGKAYRNISSARVEMTQCTGCKKWVHWGCEEASHLDACQKVEEDYVCPRCRNPTLPMEESIIQAPIDEAPPEPVPLDVPDPLDVSTFSTPPPSESGGIDQLEEAMESVQEPESDIKPPLPITPVVPIQSPTPAARKRASTSSSIGSDKASFALKGSSLDPMLCVGEDNSSDVGESPSLTKPNIGSPPRKIRHISSESTPLGREKPERHSSAESNPSSIFTDDNAQDTMSLFGIESLSHPGPTKTLSQTTANFVLSPEAKSYKIPDSFVPTGQPKVSLSPLGSPQSYASPMLKPPGPGMGKPGGMFGKGKPFGHKRRPGAARSRGKGKGKGHKRGSWSGARKRPRGTMSGKGAGQMPAGDRAFTVSGHRGLPRRPRGRFQRQCSTVSPVAEPGPSSPTTKVEPMFQVPAADDEYGDSMHNTVVLCSTEDDFTLSQDMCVVCGSFGKGSEGRLITCSQCGQCYHPYCVNLKLTKVVLRKGWRCLDCTVCEECGQVDDPAHLLLCDDCDISYHTHCLRPPLQHVPKGGWKCKWCVRCVHCGSTSPGKNCEWASNYTSCGPCASLTHCPRCKRTYKDEDIIMQCGTCERWLHAMCECLFTESDIEKVLEKGYDCVFCRPKDAVPPHIELGVQRENESMYDNFPGSVYPGRTRSDVDTVKEYQKDYTSLTMTGLQHIQRQMQKYMGHHKKRPAGPRRRGQKLGELKHAPPSAAPPPALSGPPAMDQVVEAKHVPMDSLTAGDQTSAIQPLPAPSAGVSVTQGDMSSATITATEDSGLEGNLQAPATLPEGLGSPTDGVLEPKLVKISDFPGESSVACSSASVMGIQASSKKRRKPYRPGIGGFTVRQRGRGGGLLKPRSRRGPHHRVLLSDKSGTNDTKSDTLASETTSDSTVALGGIRTALDVPTMTSEASVPVDQSTQVEVGPGPQFKPGPAEPIASVVSPLKLKISTQPTPAKTRRKKRVKLIDQFPPYLQDAFFGKKIITDAKAKSNPLDDMDEKPGSPGSSYGPRPSRDSCLVLPDKLTQRLEAAAAAANMANQASTSHSDPRSQRHPSQPQDEDSILNEQELLGVLPDLYTENILSPSALEKMVTDGLAHIDGDMADLFSDVLNNDTTTKQDNLSLEHSDTVASAHGDRRPDVVDQPAAMQKQSHAATVEDLHTQNLLRDASMQMAGPGPHRQAEAPRQMIIQQEMQQIKQQYQPKTPQAIHDQQIMHQMSTGMPPSAGFRTSQPNLNMSHTMPPGPGMNQSRVPVGPAHVTMGQQSDGPLSRSHHVTPVMSPIPNLPGQQQPHPLSHISPHPTPPPQGQFMRQASMPASLMSGMQSTGVGEVSVQQMQHSSQLSAGMARLPQSSTPPHKGTMHRPTMLQSQTSLVDSRCLQSASVPPRPMSAFADPMATTGQAMHQFQPSSAEIQHGISFQNQTMLTPNGAQRFQQIPISGQRTPGAGPDAYLSGNMPGVPQQQQQMALVQGPPPPGPAGHMHTPPPPAAISQQNTAPGQTGSVTSVDPQTLHSSVSQAMPQSVVSTTATGDPLTPTKASAASDKPEENVLVPTNLPDFPNDSNLFEPSPRPWPLGTELEGDSLSVNQRNILKWEKDEPLGELATISPVLYANVKFKDLKKEYPDWPTRAKQVAKLWRKASSDERAPFLLKARDNRAILKATRARRGDDPSASKTPTPPMQGEEPEAKQPTVQAIKQEAHVHSQLAQVHKLLQEFKQASSHGQKLKSGKPFSGVDIGVTSVPSTSPPMYQGVQAPPVQGMDPGTPTMAGRHSFAKPRPTTPKSQSPIDAPTGPPPEYQLTVKQQPKPAGASEATSGQDPVNLSRSAVVGSMVAQTGSSKPSTPAGNAVSLVQAKIERHHSGDMTSQSSFPYPQSQTPILGPSLQDSPSKNVPQPVSRSLSVGAHGSYPRSQTPRGKVSDKNPATVAAMDLKNRRLSVDSQVMRMTSPTDIDVKPVVPMSPTQTQIRHAAMYQQRSSRRARLWEQQSQPPPPYPAQTSPGGTQSFIYSHPRHQMMQMQGPRVGLLSPGPGAQTILRTPSPSVRTPGMIAFQFDGSAPHGFPPGPGIAQAPGFAAGVVPMKGYKGPHPPGAYIELTHSNQSDPATRRQNILRMGSVCSSAQASSQGSGTPVSEKQTVPEVADIPPQAKVSADTVVSSSGPSEAKSDDPFMGGHMPQDEHLDALLRSDEFKHLHFQGAAESSDTDKGDLEKVPTPASLASSVAAAFGAANSTKLVPLTSHITPAMASEPKTQDTNMVELQRHKSSDNKTSPTKATVVTPTPAAAPETVTSKPDVAEAGPKDTEVKADQSSSSAKVGQTPIDDQKSEIHLQQPEETSGDTQQPEKCVQDKSVPDDKGTEKDVEKDTQTLQQAPIQDAGGDPEKMQEDATPQKEEDSKGGEEKLPGILKTDHSYFKFGEGDPASDENPTAPPSAAAKLTTSENELLKVDLSKEPATSLRGVGLTPPPDSEAALFVPSQEGDPPPDCASALTVSNVITVPGTPPADVTLLKSVPEQNAPETTKPADNDATKVATKEILQTEDDKVSEKGANVEPVVETAKNESDTRANAEGTTQTQQVSPNPTNTKDQGKPEKEQNIMYTIESKEPKSKQKLHLELDNLPAVQDPSKSSPDRISGLSSMPKSPKTPPFTWKPEIKQKKPDLTQPVFEVAAVESTTEPAEKQSEKLEIGENDAKEKDLDPKGTSELSGKKEESGRSTETEVAEPASTDETNMPPQQKVTDEPSVSKTTPVSVAKVNEKPLVQKVGAAALPARVEPTEVVKAPESPKPTDETSTTEVPEPVKKPIPLDANKVEPEHRNIQAGTEVTNAENKTLTAKHDVAVTCAPAAPQDRLACTTAGTDAITSVASTSVSTSGNQDDAAPVSQDKLPTVSAATQEQNQAPLQAVQQPQGGTPISTVAPTQAQSVSPATVQTTQMQPLQAVTDPPAPATPVNNTVVPQGPGSVTPTSSSPPKQTNISPSRDDQTKVTPTTPQRQKPLLIKEQPLLLQELLEEEKREQERARLEKLRHTQTLLQQQANAPAPGISGIFPVPGVEMEKAPPEGGIDKIKMEFLSRINQAAQGGLAGVPPAAPVDGAVPVQRTSPMHQQPTQGRWPPHVPGPHVQQSVHWMGSDSEMRKYRNWLIQHQQVMQIQIPKQEQLVQTKKLRKQALMKKRNQCKRNNKEFAADDAEELKVVMKQYTEAQQQLEKLRNDQKQHAELIQEFNIKQQRMMGAVGTGTPGAGGTLVAQQPQVAAVMEGQVQQQILMTQPGTPSAQPQQQHIIVPPFQAQGIQGPGRMQAQNMPPQQQLIMMPQGQQQQQQQQLVKNVPTPPHVDTSTTPSSSGIPAPGRVLQQQQPQVVTATQQQLQQQAIIAQLQNMPGMNSSNPAQFHQLMINQHQFQQQQLQQQLKQKAQIQPALKGPQQRPAFAPGQSGVPTSVHTTVTSDSGNPTHNAFMQMQMQQLMALQIEQQRAAFQQTPEKPKPKRRRKKKKTQAEKEAEEQQQALAQQQQQQQQQQQIQQMAVAGNLPVTNQPHPGTWYHRPMGPAGMQPMQQHMRPTGVVQHQQRFGMVPGQSAMQMQQHVPGTLGPGMASVVQNRFGPPASAIMTPTSSPGHMRAPPHAPSQQPMNPQTMPHTMPPTPTTPLHSQAVPISSYPQNVTPTSLTPALTVSPHPHMMTQGSVPIQAGAQHPVIGVSSAVGPSSLSAPLSAQAASQVPAGMPLMSVAHPSSSGMAGVPGTALSSAQTPVPLMSYMHASTTASCVSSATAGPAPMVREGLPATSSQPMAPSQAISPRSVPHISNVQVARNQSSPAVVSTPTFHTPPGMNSMNAASVSSAERSSPRIHSPGQAMAGFEGLSEAEIAILMENDPDLNEDSISQASASMPTATAATPFLALVPEQEDKSTKEETRKQKQKRPKKGYVMDQRTIETIDESISDVIRLSVEYEDKKQAAKGKGGAEPTPAPWEIEPKPTKFPKKPVENVPFGGMGDPQADPMTSAQGNKELLKHLLKTGQAVGAPGLVPEAMPGMFGQVGSMFGMPGMAPGGMANVPYSQPQQGMGMVGGPYLMQQSQEVEPAPAQKKKRSRRGSKEVGPDGKVPKRRRKKDKNPPQTQVYQVGGNEPGGMPGQRFQVMPTVHQSVPFASPGVTPSGTNTQIAEQAAVWKRLPLLALVEPEIRRTHHMCVPKGTGLTECRQLLGGKIGDASYKGIPDLYEIFLDLEKPPETSPVPPTPPASLPPSPTHNQKQQQGQMAQMGAKTETTHSSASYPTSVSERFPSQPNSEDPAGPRAMTADSISMVHHPPLVRVPESLPTPPHQGIEDKDETAMMRTADNSVIPPSSPEMDEEDDWSPRWLTSLRDDHQISQDHQLSPYPREDSVGDGSMRDSPSPGLPLTICPKIRVPTDVGRRHGPLNDKDSVSVTIEFDNANIKSIEKSLTLLSRILDTSIISYSMVEMIRPDKTLKEALNQAIKEEQVAMPAQNNQNQVQKNSTAENEGLPRQRRCSYCNNIVDGNGVRKPQFDEACYEEDVIYCNKDCYIKCELFEKKVALTPVKKKFKASHVYQRHTCKISMATLLEKYPEEDPLTPSKSTRSSVDADPGSAGMQGPVRVSSADKGRGRGRRRGMGNGPDDSKVATKRWRGLRWKKWSVNVTVVKASTKPPVDVDALIAKYGSALKPSLDLIDRRTCVFCGCRGDGDTHTIARLLNVDVDQWVHLNCALWSAEVYETQGGALINVDLALRRSESVVCCYCQKKGATIRCQRPRCISTYHCQCALDIKCVFFKDKTVLCPTHAPKPGMSAASGFSPHQQHHSGDTLRSLAVFRKVYVQRPETKQIASIMQQGELTQGEKNYMLRVGALIFENVGQLATHQMAVCHSKTAIYPIGYKATRIYWSSTNMRRRCRYQCTVTEVDGKPKFHMSHKAALPGKNKPDKLQTHTDTPTVTDSTDVNELWLEILKPLEKLRSQHNVLKLFPDYINGEKLFGLTAPVVTRILESLPNIELCGEYKFRYGRTPLLEVPLAINPTGCARSEPHIKQHRKKPHTLISNLISEYYESSGIGDASSLYGKQFVHSKSSQYRKMKSEWRTNVYLARSRIQGLGLFAARDIEPGTMVIEYIGDIIRIEVSEKREKMYEATNRGVYMFRLDSDHIVDATVTGGPARYINHSCKPNCVAEVVNFEKEKKIMIVSNRHILKGEELSYDYKFDFEDEGRKIPCLCGASNCKKWMN